MTKNVISIFYKIIYNKQLNYFLRNINKLFYKILPSKIKIPPSGILKLKTDSGQIKMATNQTSYLTQLLFWNGYKDFEYSSIFETIAKNVDCFFDIGSNIGYYSLLGVKSNPNLKAYAFEPALGPKFYLKKNITLNSFEDQIFPIDIALSEKNGEIDFYEVQNKKYTSLKYNLAGEGNAGTKKTSRNFEKRTVKTTTFSEFCNTHSVAKIDLIKIDTEGTEHLILENSMDVINKNKPIIICETLFKTNEKELEIIFNKLNYSFYNHIDKGLVKVNTIIRTEDNNVRNCFFVPNEKIDLIKEFILN